MKVRADRLQRGSRAYLEGLDPCDVLEVTHLPMSGWVLLAYECSDGDEGLVSVAPERLIRVEVLQ